MTTRALGSVTPFNQTFGTATGNRQQNENETLLFPQINTKLPRGIGKLPNINLNQTDFLFEENSGTTDYYG